MVDIPPEGMYADGMRDRDATTHKMLVDRIARIEGQLHGVRVMIETGRGCVDVIPQINAVRQSLASLGVEMLKSDAACSHLSEEYIKALFKVQ